MSRWSTRFRRAASLLLGVHLLQVVLLAASAVCDLSVAGTSESVVAAVQAEAAHDQHAHHAQPAPATNAPTNDGPHHGSHTTSCPMAMACAATAIVVPVPSLASKEVRVNAPRIAHDAERLRSMHPTPEPPPPRA